MRRQHSHYEVIHHLKLLLEYMYGKPATSVDITSDGDKFEGFNVHIIRNREDLEDSENQ